MTNKLALTLDEQHTTGERMVAKMERIEELERVLRSVLSVIDAMQAPEGCEDVLNDSEREVNPQFVFGHSPSDWGEPAEMIEWPDLAWAKDQIVKVLGS